MIRAGFVTSEDVVWFLAWQECGNRRVYIKRHAYRWYGFHWRYSCYFGYAGKLGALLFVWGVNVISVPGDPS